MWRRWWLGGALALTSFAAQAADSQGRYAAHGLGRIECKRFIEVCEKGSDDCKLTGTWISGYLTAFNALNDRHKEHPLGDTIGRRVMGWITVKY